MGEGEDEIFLILCVKADGHLLDVNLDLAMMHLSCV